MPDKPDQQLPERVSVRRLVLTQFRNHRNTSLAIGDAPIVLTGPNGAGKTNILEALSLLSPGRGLRRASYGELASVGTQTGFAVAARVERGDTTTDIGTGTIGRSASDAAGRDIRINGETARAAENLLEWVRVVWLTPAMDGLFNGSAGDRRRFLDRMVLAIDPGHARRTLDYEKSTRSRNRLLADGMRDPRFLDAIEAQIAGTGSAIAVARNECVRLLQAMIEAQEPSNPFPQADVTIEGETEALVANMAAVDAEERFRAELRDTRERDRVAGRTLSGPHRSDLIVEHRAKQTPASLCSTGEQKALLIGLILAHARLTSGLTGMTPVMLLDEIGAHLDARRREGLFAILDGLNVQVFMTGTEATLFSALSGTAQFFTIDNGEARESA